MSTADIQYDPAEPEEALRNAKQLPDPVGFRLLIAVTEAKDTTEGGIYIPEERRQAETVASVVGFVLKAGPDAYADKDRYPNGPWCKEGDFIVMKAYSGTRYLIHGQEFRIINDDSVEGIVEDPRGIVRA
tara:strand:+ start:3353 stop:3742 length:390 start_codon:yes stop_codon:yes gene_type:complete